MEIKNSGGVYSYILKEMEWYGTSQQGRAHTIEMCMGAARDLGCKYAAILVQPDELMSVSPVAVRHKVWGHTFDPRDALKLSVCAVVSIDDAEYAKADQRGRMDLIEAAEKLAEGFHHRRQDKYPTKWEVKRGYTVLSKGEYT